LISKEDADRLREELLSVLAEDAHNTERLLTRLDSITRESGIEAHAALLLILTHQAFDEDRARRHWETILSHREQLSEALGRDAGVRVAALDYFMNINRRLTNPTLIDLELLDSSESEGIRDPLTGLASDRTFRSTLQTELRRARRYDQVLSVLLFDLDDFAEVNRRFGRLIGDRVLREAAVLLSRGIRDVDLAARPGEDELALILPETDRNGALLVAERFRVELQAFFASRESAGRPVRLTVSAGIACHPDDATTPEAILERAAQALYQAKASGKNGSLPYHQERRRFLRFDLEPGRFEVEVLAPVDRANVTPRNLSRSGILFDSPEPLEVGEEIEIRLAGSGEGDAVDALRIRGKVVRLEELPSPGAAPAVGSDLPESEDDLYEVGVVFDFDWGEGTDDLLDFLEKAHRPEIGGRR